MEMRLLFQYHHVMEVERITEQDIVQYIIFIKNVHGVGRAKCRSVAHSCSFFFKHVMKKPYVLPSKLYPRKEFVLPSVMTHDQVRQLCEAALDVRQRAIVSLLYGTGMRIGEVKNMKLSDIERANQRILVRQGKGHKDRYTLLPVTVLSDLERYYRVYLPKEFMFESRQLKGKPLHERSLQVILNSAMVKAGFEPGKFTAHTLRHTFATHLLDYGCDIHSIKTLLGHSKIETTMVYLHLQQSRRSAIVSPLDKLILNESGSN